MRNSTCLDRQVHRQAILDSFTATFGHEFEGTALSGRQHRAGILGSRSWAFKPEELLFIEYPDLLQTNKSIHQALLNCHTMLLGYETRPRGLKTSLVFVLLRVAT